MNAVLGMIYMFAGSYAPEGYALCDGKLLPIQQNQALFSIVGTTYGGDGITTFGLPKLSAPTPGINYVISTTGMYPSRS